jgi:hypothetical protein
MSDFINIKKVLLRKYEGYRKMSKSQLLAVVMDKETVEFARGMQSSLEGANSAGDEDNKKSFYQALVTLHRSIMLDPIDFEEEFKNSKTKTEVAQ